MTVEGEWRLVSHIRLPDDGGIRVRGGYTLLLRNPTDDVVDVEFTGLGFLDESGIRMASHTFLSADVFTIEPNSTMHRDGDFEFIVDDLSVTGFIHTMDLRATASTNPYDPLVGTWSLETSSENQVYVFKPDGSVNLFDYSAPDGGVVDRTKGFPDTRMTRFLGTYTWHAGPLMRINFTNSWTNEPGAEDPTLPPSGKIFEVRITRNSLILTDSTGERTYVRM